jgi:hypothetical protein
MFADDTSLTSTGNTVRKVEENLQSDFDSISTWCVQNSIVLNAQKN